jgi:hypothetical protein
VLASILRGSTIREVENSALQVSLSNFEPSEQPIDPSEGIKWTQMDLVALVGLLWGVAWVLPCTWGLVGWFGVVWGHTNGI